MNLYNLIVSHNELRSLDELKSIIQFLISRNGKVILDKATIEEHSGIGSYRPIKIVRFPDGVHMIHDGHHRCVALLAVGIHLITPAEYILEDKTYESYMQVNHPVYITPFDPKLEVRKPDFYAWKRQVKLMCDLHGVQESINYIWANRNEYAEPRRVWSLKGMSSQYEEQIRCAINNIA